MGRIMSEQTPDHSADTESGLGEGEPSMEDILASIRQIIADDADPVPLDGPSGLDMPIAEVVDTEPVTAADNPAQPEAVEPLDPDTLDIDALLSGIDVVEPESPPVSLPEIDVADTIQAEVTAPAPVALDDDLIDMESMELDIPLVPADAEPVEGPQAEAQPLDAESLGERAARSMLSAPPAMEEVGVDDDLDSLMDELLVELDDAPTEPERVVDPGEAVIEAEAAEARELPDMDTDEDMDLVRSLMDDLTDEEVEPSAAGAVELDETESAEPEAADEAEPSAHSTPDDEADILDSILDMTLDDAIADQPLDIPEPEPELAGDDGADPVGDIAAAMPVPDVPAAHDAPSLSAIAASAEADAESVQAAVSPASAVPTGAVAAALAGGAAIAGGAAMATDEPAEPGPQPGSSGDAAPAPAATAHTPTEPTPPKETPMPRAVRSDAILDEVTEEATASAFAELNQVVEDKAVFEERGPRIGDLVQEALKPMLKEWLDANLKGIVERAVAKEVKRISSGK